MLFDIHNVLLFLPPTIEVRGKVMFLHLCVILFMGEGGLPTPPDADLSRAGQTPPRCRPPWVGQTLQMETPPGLGRPPRIGERGDADPPGLGGPPRCRPPGLGRPPPRCRPLQGWADPPRCRPPRIGQTPQG